jgi:uncharacterized protein (TIGR02001 family)
MNKLLVAALATAFALPALAEDSPVSSNVSLTTNYLYRGVSQTGNKPAIQGGFDYANPSGLYAGVWGSSISWISDAGGGAAGGGVGHAGTELDTYLGFSSSFAGDFTYDVGFLRYNYPGEYNGNLSADTNEIYGKIGYKWVSFKYSNSLTDLFGVADTKGSTYLDLSASYDIEGPGISVGAHYGKQKYGGSGCSGCDYADYNVSVSKDFSGYGVGLMYSKTDISGGLPDAFGSKLADGKVVLSLSHSM